MVEALNLLNHGAQVHYRQQEDGLHGIRKSWPSEHIEVKGMKCTAKTQTTMMLLSNESKGMPRITLDTMTMSAKHTATESEASSSCKKPMRRN